MNVVDKSNEARYVKAYKHFHTRVLYYQRHVNI